MAAELAQYKAMVKEVLRKMTGYYDSEAGIMSTGERMEFDVVIDSIIDEMVKSLSINDGMEKSSGSK